MFGLVEKAEKTNLSIWCDYVEPHPEMKANSRLTFTTIVGRDEMGEYQWKKFSSFVGAFDQAGIQSAVDSLLAQAADGHHIFIEGFEKNEDGSFEVVLGS